MNWTSKSVAVWLDWQCGDYKLFKKSFNGNWFLLFKDKEIGRFETIQEAMVRADSHDNNHHT